MAQPGNIVSFEDEELILVDEGDRELGHAKKGDCHDGDGVLHRAFSVFLFNERGEVLLQQRSAQKRLWPLFWANSCCSHPRRGEDVLGAATRRLEEELSVRAGLSPLYSFIYQARYGTAGSEHELCHVLVGKCGGAIAVNPREVAAHRFVGAGALDRELREHPEHFTPWLKLEWARLRRDFAGELSALGAG